ncbi:hypothetical protein C4561_01605 [candidate division WWE3 bacterium]|uniref:Uncharacterized protein n=1 Tax=candidate division WWE3 bacterium TaxID=2053526 RepID=A0A3A4ZF45_UNCKA|nr:MAG: hypothetical protein C4561_01605 [candidate division WWE3 bacterium]
MAFQLSVAWPPVYNYSFDMPTKLKSTLAAGVTAGVSSIQVTASNWSQYIVRGDFVVLGASSATGHLGKTEVVQVSDGTTNPFTTVAPTVNAYSAGDSVEVFGSRVAGGWQFNGDASLIGTGIYQFLGDPYSVGFDVDGCLQRLSKTVGTTNSYLNHALEDHFLMNTFHRAMCYYKLVDVVSSPFFAMTDGAGTYGSAALSSGEGKSVISILSAGSVPASTPQLYFQMGSTNVFTALYIDLVTVGHAKLTSGAGVGYISLPTSILGSIDCSFKVRVRPSFFVNSLGVSGFKQTLKHKSSVAISLEFEANNDTIRDLEVLKFWQDRGCKLILENDIGSGSTLSLQSKVAPLILGTIDYSINKRFWNQNLNRVNFTFEGE